MRLRLAVTIFAMACPGVSPAGPVSAADAEIVATYPDAEIAKLAAFLKEGKSPDFERDQARSTICSRLGAKPWRDTVTLEAFLTAWERESPAPTGRRMQSELKLADLFLKTPDEAETEAERTSRIQRAVPWLEKILATDSEKVALQAVAGDWQTRARQPGAREMYYPLPPEMVEERAQRILARVAGDARNDAIKWRQAAANRLAHQAALVAEATGDFTVFDDLVKRHGTDAEVGEIFVSKRLRSQIYGGSRGASIPIPKTTPYDSDAAERVNYLEGFSFGYRSIVAGMKVDYPRTGEDPHRKAEREGWKAGMAQALEDRSGRKTPGH